MPTKLVLADKTALDGKYGADAQKVWDAIDLLIAADANRGIVTSLRLLDPADATDPVQAKAAIDAALQAPAPDYAVLLGGPDLLAHVPLENPASDDGDAVVPSDLPYACDARYSTRIADFLAPTRVITRLPDVPGATDPAPLLAALATATAYASRPAAAYAPPLGVTAEVWETSTTLTLTQLFGAGAKVRNVPDDGPAWGAALGSLSHFFNCHGSPSTPTYYGQRGGNYPAAHEAALVDGHVDDGTVLAAECCYGAQLYDPQGGQLGMPFAYLRSGAYAVFGSTTIAYGPADSTANADVLCRLFLASILAGGSVGRAGLEARQSYIGRSSPLDPIDLKTAAQFLVLGDASVHPSQGGGPIGQGRDELARKGGAIGAVTSFAERIEDAGGDIVDLLTSQFAHAAPGEASVASYDIQGGVLSRRLTAGESARIHVVLQTLDMPGAPLAQRIATVGIERFGRLVQVRTAMSR